MPRLQAGLAGLEIMAEGVGIIDIDGQLLYANPMAQKILGLKEDEIKKRTYHDEKWTNLRLDGSLLPAEEHPMSITLTTGENVYDHEIGVRPPNGEVFYLAINAAPIRDENGVIIGGIGTFMDVTQRRLVIRQKEEFISVASHELRTPITTLKAALQLLDRLKDNPGPMLPKLVDQANKSLSKLSTLVEDLLNASRLTEGNATLKSSVFPIASLIEECVKYINMESRYKITCQGDPCVMVLADTNKIEQVIVNLLNNAIKYAPDSNSIEIAWETQGDRIRVAIIDHGQGISAEKLPFLFNRYYRAADGKNSDGLGLGLYICSEIIKQHGGEVGVDSVIGVGSTFWFTLKQVQLNDKTLMSSEFN
ncbi:PAS domain-containing protein [Mucilaginibacter sp. 21P]|uniref:PAS domain-containing sensor histidine kinase n=1 Tax=Mucilaginibacter sp. 21P TaxID=2778902 RepID=UPI001C58D6DB|nr:ATP-binding protein [Mucilaginibacter sp. 21P]QXV63684.1 PAS domain-containing protein [Mucilaginibacter sp. 21P]